jgi:hypothetical protein
VEYLIELWVIYIPYAIVLERTIKSRPIIRSQREPFLQSLRQIRIANEISPIDQGVIAPGLENTPGVRVVESARREKWRVAKDLAERRKIDGWQSPRIEELLLLCFAEDLLVALGDNVG